MPAFVTKTWFLLLCGAVLLASVITVHILTTPSERERWSLACDQHGGYTLWDVGQLDTPEARHMFDWYTVSGDEIVRVPLNPGDTVCTDKFDPLTAGEKPVLGYPRQVFLVFPA